MKRINGWDERDYMLRAEILQLSSYDLLPNGDRKISRNAVIKLLEQAAEKRGYAVV